ncbi:cilia- and flagella-associated protein 206 [Pseudoliparis swirei]|uniref:cilia- and flagella-associated protein 206 n=1 Tax=Pseudoliparis swirei TaxID=2059687 RepID=UPI0024BEF379|nr:cilia- and flagella-associated protein 206 [Pseudoliparis swirei]
MSVRMSGAHAECVIKNIILEIVHESAARGHVVSDTLAAFMVKAVVLDPRNGFNVDRTLTIQDVQKLQELCLDKLSEQCSPSLDTIKMQVYFDISYTSRREFLEEVHRAAESRLSAVSREITDSRAKTGDDMAALYRRIVAYMQLSSGLVSPTDRHAEQEAAAALQSVFPQTELGAFMVLLKRDKEQQLRELATVVTGIRLFNRAGGAGGEEAGLRELTSALLSEVLPVAGSGVEQDLSASQASAWRYTALQERPAGGRHDAPTAVLRALYNVRQHEAFLKMLLSDLRLGAQRVETLQTELASQMKMLKETVQSQTAVPTAKVFPLFKSLSKLWSGLRDEAELLSILGDIARNLRPFVASQAEIFPREYVDGLLEAAEVKTDDQRMAESSGERLAPAEMESQDWLLPETTVGFNELPLQYNGVCGSTLVSRDGLLLPGNPHIGVLKHEEKLYVFSSREAALTFASSPGDFVAEVAEKAKLFPELIQLLGLHQQFSCVGPYSELQPGESFPGNLVTKCESGTQTDVHPPEANVVGSYDWNEWELRRKAIKLADLRTKLTRSVQTDLSHMRRESATQTWLPRNAACQSKREGGSNVPKPQVYVAGLRGQRHGRVVKTNLTRPVEEK